MSTLGFERGTAGMLENIRYGAVVERLVDMARQRLGASALENDDIGQRLAQLRAEVTAVRAMTYRIASRAAIAPPGSLSDERRVCKECVRTFLSRLSPYLYTNNFLHHIYLI